MTEQHDLSATMAVSLMRALGSCETSISLRTISGRLKVTVLGDALASAANILTAASLVCQRCSSKALKSRPSMASTETGLSAAIMASPACARAGGEAGEHNPEVPGSRPGGTLEDEASWTAGRRGLTASAASWTGFCLSAHRAMTVGKTVTRYGSVKKTPASLVHLARSSTVVTMRSSIAGG